MLALNLLMFDLHFVGLRHTYFLTKLKNFLLSLLAEEYPKLK